MLTFDDFAGQSIEQSLGKLLGLVYLLSLTNDAIKRMTYHVLRRRDLYIYFYCTKRRSS